MNRVKQRPQVTPEISSCCGNHSCKTKERQKESFSLPMPCYTKPKKSPEEGDDLHDLTYKCISKPGTAHSLPAMKKGSSKTEKQNIGYAILTLQFPVFLTDLWQVIRTNQPPVTRLTFVTQTDTLPIHFCIGRICFHHEIFHALNLEGDRGHVESGGRQKSLFFQIPMFQIFITEETEKQKYQSQAFCWVSRKQLQIKPTVLQSRTNNRWKIWPENAAGTEGNSFSVSSVSWVGSLNYSGWGAGSCSVHSHCSYRAVPLLFMAQKRGKVRKEELYSRAGTPIIPLLLLWDPISTPLDVTLTAISSSAHSWMRHLFFWIISLTNIAQGCYQPESIITPVVRSLFAYTQRQVSS